MTATTSPRGLARTAGSLYLVNIVFGAFALGVVPSMLFVAGDAGATAHNVQAHELLYREGLAAHVVVGVTNVGLALIFYELFKVVDRRLAALVVFFTLVATSIEMAGVVGQFVPLLKGQPTGTAAYQSFALATVSYDVSDVFFALYAVTIGYLVFQSTFLPRWIGVLMLIDGVAYVIYSFADFLFPGFASHLVPWIQLPILAGEGSLTVWFLIAGIDVPRWEKRAAQAGTF